MFGSCFTPKPAHSGAPMAQLRVVDSSPYKIVDSYVEKEDDVAHKASSIQTTKRSGRASLQPAQALVRKLNESAEKRSVLASLLKEHCLVEGGDSNVSQWLKDEGINAPIGSVLKVNTEPDRSDCRVIIRVVLID